MFQVGDYVYWSDPDNNLCDTPGHIVGVSAPSDDPVFVIETDSGGVVEAYAEELSLIDPSLIRADKED